MRAAVNEQNSIWNDKAPYALSALVGIDAFNRPALFLTAMDVVAIRKRELKGAGCDLIGAFPIARCELYIVSAHRIEKRFAPLISPYRKQRRNMRGRGAKKRIGDDRLAMKTRVSVGQYGRRVPGGALGNDQHAGPGGEAGPITLRVAEPIRNPFGARRAIGCQHALLPEHLCADRLVGPVHIGLRIRFLTNQPIHDPGTLGFLRVIDRPHADAGITLEILEYRLREDLVLADVDHHYVVTVTKGRPDSGRSRRQYDQKQQDRHTPIHASSAINSLGNAPWRAILPRLQDTGRPGRRLFLVTAVARIRNLQCIALRRRDEAEGVGAHVHVPEGLLDLGHVAGNALVTGTVRFVMRVRFDCRCVRTNRRIRAMAVEADVLGRLPQDRIVLGAMHIVTAE